MAVIVSKAVRKLRNGVTGIGIAPYSMNARTQKKGAESDPVEKFDPAMMRACAMLLRLLVILIVLSFSSF
jgi:hypothetical protein